MTKKIYFILGIVLGIVFLYFSIKDLNSNDLRYLFDNLEPIWILPMLGCGALFFIFKAIRWRYLLRPFYKAEVTELFPSLMMGSAVGYLVSIYLGEFVRIFCFSHQTSLKKSSVLANIFLERLWDLLILLTFFSIGLIYAPKVHYDIGYMIMVGGILLFGFMLFAVFKTEMCLKVVHWLTRWLPRGHQQKLIEHIDRGILGLHSLKDVRLLGLILFTSIIGWMFMAFANHLSILAVGVNVPLSASFLVMGLILMGMSLPSVPGGIGVIEWCYIMGLRPYGVEANAAFAAALVFHIFIYLGVIIVGFAFSKSLNINLVSMVRQHKN